jgi:hypothetical protein
VGTVLGEWDDTVAKRGGSGTRRRWEVFGGNDDDRSHRLGALVVRSNAQKARSSSP